MAGARSRTMRTVSTGSKVFGSTLSVITYTDSETITLDTVGYRGLDNPFNLRRYEAFGGLMSGSYHIGTVPVMATNVPFPPRANADFLAAFSSGSNSVLASKLASMSSPSRTVVNLPVFWAELRDVPKMIRHGLRTVQNIRTGRPLGGGSGLSQLKEAAATNLAIQFGWLPFIRDLSTLLSFQSAVERRRLEFDKLYSGRGLKRRMDLESFSNSDIKTIDWSYDGVGMATKLTRSTTRKSWGTIRWKPSTASQLPPVDRDLQLICLGLVPQNVLSAAWEAMPWSWLIDWFSNTGDLISLTNNSADAKISNLCIMSHTQATKSWTGQSKGGQTVTGGTAYSESKTRDPKPLSLLPQAKLPILTGSQLSILGSLLLTRT